MLLLSICMSLLENYLTLSFPAIFVKEKYPWLKWVFMGILTLTSFYLDTLNYPFLMLIPLIIIISYCLFNFDEDKGLCIFYIIFAFTILSLLDMFCIFIEMLFIKHIGQIDYNDEFVYQICFMMNKIVLVLIFVFFRRHKMDFKDYNIKKRQMVMFSITETIMYFLMAIVLSLFIKGDINYTLSTCIIIFMAIMFLLFFYQYIELIGANKKLLDEEIKHAALEFNKTYYEDFQKSYDMNKALSHDLKNHITLIYTMLQENQVNNAMKYIQDIYHKIGTFKAVKTDREILNYIIDSKLFNTKGLNIRYVIDINDNLDFMDNIDLCILLGNLLDNCIEAVEKVNNRFIELIIDKNKDVVFINLRNTFDSSRLKYENGEYITNKSDGKNHGIGMKNIESIINKYNGNIVIDIDEYFNTYIYF